ncbi:MAG: penicillin-binding protein, partial [Saprospiraceae bacterium]
MKKELLVRAYIVLAMFVVLSFVIIYRVFTISVVDGDKWRAKANVNVQLREVDADRGDIYADDFSVLATSIQYFEIRMDMTIASQSVFNEGLDSLALLLSTTYRTDLSKSQWKDRLKSERKKKNAYFFIAKGLDISQRNEILDFPILRNGRYRGGAIAIRYAKRTRPFKQLARRTIGEDRDNSQKVGLEGYYDKVLKGPFSQRVMKRVSADSDQWVPVYDFGDMDVQKGDDIVATINIPIQDIAQHELETTLISSDAKAGTVIVMEVSTGKIKAISNLSRQEDGSYAESYNYAIGNASEPGSTFKLASVLALLEDHKADIDDYVDVYGGKKKFYDRWMYDSEPHHRARVTMKEAFEISSNVGIAAMVHEAYNNKDGKLKYYNRLKSFGLTEPTGVELNGEPKPYIKNPSTDKDIWYGTTVPWMAHGYELQLTPLQILNFYNAIANNGDMMKPMLVSQIRKENEVVKDFHPIILKQKIASAESIAKVKDMMEGVVEEGTGKKLQSDLVKIAGKTGTTRVNYNSSDDFKKYNASFAGYFPAEKPKYSMIVVVYEPIGSFYGASVAGPVFKNIAERVINIEGDFGKNVNIANVDSKNIPGKHKGYNEDFKEIFDYVGIQYKEKTEDSWVSVNPFDNKMLIDENKVNKETIPSVVGMGARDAVYVLENMGLKVNIDGVGRVITQNILPGTPA